MIECPRIEKLSPARFARDYQGPRRAFIWNGMKHTKPVREWTPARLKERFPHVVVSMADHGEESIHLADYVDMLLQR